MPDSANPTSPASSPEATQQCARCGASEPNWQHNRCPNCGEMATQRAVEQASAGQVAPSESDGYIGCVRLRHRGERPYLSLCDSDADGAFKIYRNTQVDVRAERDELRSQLAAEKERADSNWDALERIKPKWAEARGIAGALAERLMRHVCQKDDCEDASHKKDKVTLAKWKAAGISLEEKPA